MANEAFGWLWIGLGFASGSLLGMGFAREGFLGGYGSWERRLVRLGHISLVALGVLNILFAQSAPRIAVAPVWLAAAAWAMIAGSVLMPACCAIAAKRRGAVPLFAAPVLLLSFAATVAWVGLLLGWSRT
jgi:hypothetical protein